MPKASPIQNNFNAGEFSPLMYGRTDFPKYKSALALCENFVPLVQGGITSRPGTKYVAKAKDSANAVRVVPFQFSISQAYILEFGEQYIRVYKDHGQVTLAPQNVLGITNANPAVLNYDGADTYANGDRVYVSGVAGMTQINNRECTVANVNAGANTFELSGVDSTGYGTYTSGGTVAEIYTITSPYSAADLFELKFAQSADVLYIAHPSYAPRTLSRTAHTSWTLATYTPVWGPFLAENLTEAYLVTASAATGAGITLTASGGHTPFNANHVGAYWKFREVLGAKYQKWEAAKVVGAAAYRYYEGRLYYTAAGGTTGTNPPIHTAGTESDGAVSWQYKRGDRGYAQITAYTSSTLVTATVIKELPASATGSGTFMWAEGAWSPDEGYPSCATFFEDRLVWAGSTGHPQTIWMSASGEYDIFREVADSGDVTDAEAIALTLNANDVNAIRWLIDDEKALIVGTSGGEWTLRPFQSSEAFSATNVNAKRSTTHGCANLQPVKADRACIFVQRSGKKVRELAYVFEIDGFRAPDMSVLAEHITDGGLVQLAYAREPQSVMWAATADGELVGMTYEREQDVVAWHRHPIGGSGIVESVAVIPSPDGTYDELWLVVRRTINGSSVRYIEYMEKFWTESTGKADSFYVDCGATYSGAAASTITGLYHLEGETVSVLAGGAAHPNVTVSGGAITLTRADTPVHVGKFANRDADTLRIEAGSADGTAQGKTKRIHGCTLRFYNTIGCKLGPSADKLSTIYFRSASDPMDDSPALFSGDKKVEFEGDYETEGKIYVRQDQPLPCTLLAIMPQLVTQD